MRVAYSFCKDEVWDYECDHCHGSVLSSTKPPHWVSSNNGKHYCPRCADNLDLGRRDDHN